MVNHTPSTDRRDEQQRALFLYWLLAGGTLRRLAVASVTVLRGVTSAYVVIALPGPQFLNHDVADLRGIGPGRKRVIAYRRLCVWGRIGWPSVFDFRPASSIVFVFSSPSKHASSMIS